VRRERGGEALHRAQDHQLPARPQPADTVESEAARRLRRERGGDAAEGEVGRPAAGDPVSSEELEPFERVGDDARGGHLDLRHARDHVADGAREATDVEERQPVERTVAGAVPVAARKPPMPASTLAWVSGTSLG
jgi:hypothetical protein